MILKKLVAHLEKFVRGEDISVQWAKDAESLLDDIDESGEIDELESALDSLQEYLSLYRPEGGEHLCNENDMRSFCIRLIPLLLKKTEGVRN